MISSPLTPQQIDPNKHPRSLVYFALSGAKFLVVVALIAFVFVIGRDFAQQLAIRVSPDHPTEAGIITTVEVQVEIPVGASARSIARILEDKGIIPDAENFEAAVRASGLAGQLKAGNFTLVAGAANEVLIEALVAGPPPVDVYRVTVVEGLTVASMLEALASQTEYLAEEFEEALLSGAVFSSWLLGESLPTGIELLQAWEGLLFPDTYEFRADAEPEEILQRMATTLETRLAGIDWTGLEELGLTPYEGIIIASLVEREAKLDEDRPLISSVIHNRLTLRKPLEIDATVIYAIGENRGRVLDADLQIDSPYNTYKIVGLPPTPIAGVRLASLEAAAFPAQSDFLFYVLVDVSGKHGFSATFAEHQQKIAQARQDGILP